MLGAMGPGCCFSFLLRENYRIACQEKKVGKGLKQNMRLVLTRLAGINYFHADNELNVDGSPLHWAIRPTANRKKPDMPDESDNFIRTTV